jgi:hypothetical protein
MYEVAMFLSIVSSVLFCIYLLMCIFGTTCRTHDTHEPTITITGRIVTKTVTFTTINENFVDNDIPVYTMPKQISNR